MSRPEMDPNLFPPSGLTDLHPPHGALDDDPQALADQMADAIQVAARPQDVAVNMYEATGALVVVAPLPGVMAEDISIEVARDSIRIYAEARTLAPKAYLRHEWHYGPYERTVGLPEGFEGEASASFGNGQLALRIGRGGERSSPVIVQPS